MFVECVHTSCVPRLYLILFWAPDSVRYTVLIIADCNARYAVYIQYCVCGFSRPAIARDWPTNRRDKLLFRPYQLFVFWASIVYNSMIMMIIIITVVFLSARPLTKDNAFDPPRCCDRFDIIL